MKNLRNLWTKAGILGSVSMAFGSILWSQKKPESDQCSSSCTADDTTTGSPYKLQLVQVLFRHGARTPLKSIPNVMEVTFFFLSLSLVSPKDVVSHVT